MKKEAQEEEQKADDVRFEEIDESLFQSSIQDMDTFSLSIKEDLPLGFKRKDFLVMDIDPKSLRWELPVMEQASIKIS